MTRRGPRRRPRGVDGDRYRRSDVHRRRADHRHARADHRGGGDQHGSARRPPRSRRRRPIPPRRRPPRSRRSFSSSAWRAPMTSCRIPTPTMPSDGPVFLRSQGQGMMLVVEARQGASRLDDLTYDPSGFAPGIEIIASRPLGDGSPAVCDYDPPLIGGVPGVDPLAFDDSPRSATRSRISAAGSTTAPARRAVATPTTPARVTRAPSTASSIRRATCSTACRSRRPGPSRSATRSSRRACATSPGMSAP